MNEKEFEKGYKKALEEISPVKDNYLEIKDTPDLELKKDKNKSKEDKKKKKETWWSKVFNKDKLKKSNKVAVVFLRNNGNAELLQQESRNGFFTVNGKNYHERRDCTYTITKDRIPLIILKEWDMLPEGTKAWDDKEMREKFSELENHVLKGIRYAELVKTGGITENSISIKQAIIWGIAALVIGAVVINYI